MNKIKAFTLYLNSKTAADYSKLLIAFYLLCALFVVARYDWNPTALVRFGHYYVEQNPSLTPDGAIQFVGNEENGGNGYDGQIFYYYAETLFSRGVWPEGFNNAYRAPRVGYPFLAALFSVFGPWGTVFGMIFVQLALLVGGLYALYGMLPSDRKFLVLFYLFSPFSLQSFLVLVSDGVMASLAICGYYFFQKIETDSAGKRLHLFRAFLLFSLAILTKESSLFLLFPLGLYALYRRDLLRAGLMVSVLLPMILWQLYLREAHGMLPAGVLKIFLSPLDGVIGLLRETTELLSAFMQAPSGALLFALMKHSAKLLLFFLIPAALYPVVRGGFKAALPVGLAILLTVASTLIADFYYFWSVYENISRMFTLLVPLMILFAAKYRDTTPFFAVLTPLAVLVFVRTLVLTPVFPFYPHRAPEVLPHHAHPPILFREKGGF